MMEMFYGSEKEFSTEKGFVCCDERKKSLCMHSWEKKSILFTNTTPFLPHFQLYTHTYPFYQLRAESGKHSSGSSHWSMYSSWVMRSSRDGLSSVVTEWRYRGDEDGLDDGGGAPTPAPLNTPQKPKQRYKELLKRQVTWRKGLG